MYGAIDAGGTTFKCAIADESGSLVARRRVPTTTPGATIEASCAFFRKEQERRGGQINRLGLAAFGPIDVDCASNTYGHILNTPKAGWSNTDLKGQLQSLLGVEVVLDTDVNAALLAELNGGAADGAERAAYVTVGTGIGAGFVQERVLIAKPLHPEFGHIAVERYPGDTYEGCCAYHKNCLEGLASARAFEARWGPASDLKLDHEGWITEGYYLAQLCLAINLFLRPQKIVLGGGLMQGAGLIDKVRAAYELRIAGYLSESESDISSLITLPHYGDDAGLMGAHFLARGA